MKTKTRNTADTTKLEAIEKEKAQHPPVSPMDSVPNNDVANADSDVTDIEKQLLEKTENTVGDDTAVVEKLALDQTDGQDPLNEEGNPSDMGANLDIPGAELDDENEEIGSEDEENNPYTNSNIDEE